MSGDGGPGGLSALGRGGHVGPEQGACVMEYVSILVGEPFSDRPRCTHPVLGMLARGVNDLVSDTARAQLVTGAPDLARYEAEVEIVIPAVGRPSVSSAPGLPVHASPACLASRPSCVRLVQPSLSRALDT